MLLLQCKVLLHVQSECQICKDYRQAKTKQNHYHVKDVMTLVHALLGRLDGVTVDDVVYCLVQLLTTFHCKLSPVKDTREDCTLEGTHYLNGDLLFACGH